MAYRPRAPGQQRPPAAVRAPLPRRPPLPLAVLLGVPARVGAMFMQPAGVERNASPAGRRTTASPPARPPASPMPAAAGRRTPAPARARPRFGRPATTSVRPFWIQVSSAGQSASFSSASGISTSVWTSSGYLGQVGHPLGDPQAVLAQHLAHRRPTGRGVVPLVALRPAAHRDAPAGPAPAADAHQALGHQPQHPVVHPAELALARARRRRTPSAPPRRPPASPGAAAPAAVRPGRAGSRRWSGAPPPGSAPPPSSLRSRAA